MKAIADYLESATADGAHPPEAHLYGAGAVATLEARLKEFYGMRYALLVSNATMGLFLIALALELRRSEFLTTPYTYGGSLSGWLALENKPVFCDIEPDTLTLSSADARHAISTRTKALLSTDIYGTPADMLALRRTADDYGLWLISDAAQSFGATRDHLPASALADALVVSFTSGKTLFAGEGGAILTNHADVFEKLVWLGAHPNRQRRDLGLELYNEMALNCRPHPLAAIWANAVFEESLKRLKARQSFCLRALAALNSSGLTEPLEFEQRNILPSFFRLSAAWKKRDEKKLIQSLKASGFNLGIEPAPVRLIYKQPEFIAQYGGLPRGIRPCREAEHQAAQRFCLSLA